MDAELYNAAVSGNIAFLVENNDRLVDEVTPNKNTVLHLISKQRRANKPGGPILGGAVYECVRRILSMQPSLIFRVNSNGDSALHLAARSGHYEMVRGLVELANPLDPGPENGSELAKQMLMRMRNVHGDTALYDAVRSNEHDIVQFLTSEDPEFSHTANNIGETPLYIAAERGYGDLVEVILKTCTSPAYSGPCGRTALHGAVLFHRFHDCTCKLLAWKQSLIKETDESKLLAWKQSLIKETDEMGWTPLHYAAFLHGFNSSLVSHLLSVDKSVAYLVDKEQNTALHLAASRGYICKTKELIRHCPDCLEMVNNRGQSILHIALEHKERKFVNYILRKYKGTVELENLVAQKDVDGNTALHLMAASNWIISELVHHPKADKNALNNKNLAPLDMVDDHLFSSEKLRSLTRAGARFGLRREINKGRMTIKDVEARASKIEGVLKETAERQMIVAALIATVTFTAGFTVPGGYYQSGDPNPGLPVLARKAAFRAFIISDAVGLLLSSIALFLILSSTIFESTYTVFWLVRCTSILVTASILAMIIAFSTGTYVTLAPSLRLTITICVMGVISLPIYVLIIKKLWASRKGEEFVRNFIGSV